MKLFTYVFDTEGGTDWTQEYVVMAEDRKHADAFIDTMKEKEIVHPEYPVLLDVQEEELQVPCFWGN